jgi:cytoskeleton protein RodZ
MSDQKTANQGDAVSGMESTASLTAGAMLRKARMAAGLHVAALAVSMKVPVKKLEALESDRLDLLPDAVFVRALASSVCRTLKIDPIPILAKLPKNSAVRLRVGNRDINEPFQRTGVMSGSSLSAILTRPVVLVVLGLLMAATVLLFLPEIQKMELSLDAVRTQTKPSSALVASEVPKKPDDVGAALMPPIVDSPGLAGTAMSMQPSSSASAITQESLTTFTAPVPQATSTQLAAPVAGNLAEFVVFKAHGSTWVQVVDAKGTVQLSKTLANGETISAGGSLPLTVVIGRADVTDVEVRGKAFSLASIVKDNVARFEVK